MVGKSKNKKRTQKHFKYFPQLLGLVVNENRNAALQRKGTKIVPFLPIVTGQFCLLSYWLTTDIRTFPSDFPIPF
jgi:hypothetical protein